MKPHKTSLAFLEERLSAHNKVVNFTKTDEYFYKIQRCTGLVEINLLLVDCYTIGFAEYIYFKKEFPIANAIVTSSNWNRYTLDAKNAARQEEVGLFNIGEFLGALNFDEFWNYVKKTDKEDPFAKDN
ncbi:hypothetical protein [Anaerobacillus sp. 1_MG-2023]|uniref:hypothetical protein n=1 Tax=Anaerobacillus sp. 1_MG-2023 TaxID=3062655 RepID=UPI0026E1B4EC|nr:hypothetical protein [Anaerobacillus sp. 1_MG-2023]MDO6658002.1 hypothetical protein [Anaerobacillus sp. 1_MG-2023]